MTPDWIAAILESNLTWLFAKIMATFVYWFFGLKFALNLDLGRAVVTKYKMRPVGPVLALTMFVQFVGSGLVISGYLVWLGAGMLGVFTSLTLLTCHTWWKMEGAERIAHFNESIVHLSGLGGMLAVAILDHTRSVL